MIALVQADTGQGLVARVSTALRPERVEAIRKSIDFRDRVSLGAFGSKAQQAVSEFADRLLAKAQGEDVGDPETVVKAMLAKAQEVDTKPLRNPGLLVRVTSTPKGRTEQFKAKVRDVSGAIDGLAVEVERYRVFLRSDIAAMEDLYDGTLESIRDLDEHIEAGRLAAQDQRARLGQATAGDTNADDSERMMRAQHLRDAEQSADRLEKQVLLLRQARQIAFQQLPEIRLLQSGNETLIQNLDAAIDLTIPGWKQKMALILGINRQGRALAMDRAIAGANGRLMVETAELLRSQSFEIEERSQEGLLDLDALEEANGILIDTLKGVSQRQVDGRVQRKESEARLATMARDLGSALSEHAVRA